MISCLRSWLFGESESNTNRCTYKCMKNFAENIYALEEKMRVGTGAEDDEEEDGSLHA